MVEPSPLGLGLDAAARRRGSETCLRSSPIANPGAPGGVVSVGCPGMRRSVDQLTEGEGDDLPESAFMYVGTLDDARAKAEKKVATVAS